MSKLKNKLIPELRFPEFENEKEWEETTFEELFTIGNGRDYKHLDRGEIPVYGSGGYMLSVNDFLYDGESVCIGRKGTIDKPMFLKGKFWTVDTLFYTHSFKDCTPKYIYYVFQNINWLKHNEAGGVPSLSKANIYKIEIAIPSIKEQKKIASILSSLDEVITVESQKLENLKTNKKGLMQNLFPQEGKKVPKYRFPEFRNDGDWVEKKIIETTDKKVKWSFIGGPFGSNLKTSEYTKRGIRIIQLQNIGEGEFKDNYKIYTSVEKADELLSCNIYAGDIILSKMGDPVGRACFIPQQLKRCVMASDGIRLVVNEKQFSKYLVYSVINSKAIRKAIEKKATGSTRKRIGLNDLKEILLLLPKNHEEQIKIASCLLSLDNLITAQIEKIEQLNLHKKGLMQGLFPKISN